MPQSFEERLPQKSIIEFVENLKVPEGIPPLWKMRTVINGEGKKEPIRHYIQRMYRAYFAVIEKIDSITEREISQAVHAMNSALEEGIAKKEDGKFPTAEEGFRALLLESISLGKIIDDAIDSSAGAFGDVRKTFAAMFNKGIVAKQEGKLFQKNDSYWDDILVGTFFLTTSEALVHYVLSHSLAVAIRVGVKESGRTALATCFDNKETVHNMISMVIRILAANKTIDQEIVLLWNKNYDEGGVAWHADKTGLRVGIDPIQKYFDKEFTR